MRLLHTQIDHLCFPIGYYLRQAPYTCFKSAIFTPICVIKYPLENPLPVSFDPEIIGYITINWLLLKELAKTQ